ncbi:MAG: hypothetical protein HPY53_14190 [Brevinematales bacterium]|nr:hypothetical protein [Brevinematales bacterium]
MNQEIRQTYMNTRTLVALIIAIVLFIGGGVGLVALRSGYFLFAVLFGLAAAVYAVVSGGSARKEIVEAKPLAKTDWTLVKYYLIMGGILLLEFVLLYLVFMFMSTAKWLYVLTALGIFIAIAVFLISTRIREKTKVKPVNEVAASYLRVTVWSVLIVFGIFGIMVIIKTVSLLAIFI